jgi:DNA repair ATPase RecN
MPTGYTVGILDGKIKTFQEFAKLCMRNFGATIHMRDESLDNEYESRVPSDYNLKKIKELRNTIKEMESLTDEQLIKERKKELLKKIKRTNELIFKITKDKELLQSMLYSAVKYIPPTKEHVRIKEFMIEQLESTIRFDGDVDYNIAELSRMETELKNINPDIIRLNEIKDAKNSLEYHLKEYNNEIRACSESNAWVDTFLKSLN